jgi:uncharacterized membrane protein
LENSDLGVNELRMDSSNQGNWNERVVLVIVAVGVLPLVAGISSLMQYRGVLLAIYLLIGLMAFIGVLRRTDAFGEFIFMTSIFSMSLCLIVSSALVSPNLRGWDVHYEYYQFSQVYLTGRWNILSNDIYNSVLSVTVLPTIASLISGVDGLKLFEVVFPLVYSVVPLALYKIFRKMLVPSAAFLSTFLFMAYPTFFEELRWVARQEIAELVMLTLLLLLLTPRISRSLSGKFLILLFTLGLVVSHYALAYFFLGLLLFSFVVSRVSKRSTLSGVSISTMLIALVLTLGWYSSVAGGSGVLRLDQAVSLVYGGIQSDLFASGSSVPSVVQAAATFGGLPGWLHDANKVSQYAVQIFLFLGFLILVRKRGKSITEYQFLPLTAGAMAFLIASLFLPFLAFQLNLSRIYHIALIFVAPCLCYGVDFLCFAGKPLVSGADKMNLPKLRSFRVSRSVAATVLICYFLFVGGWVWAVTNDAPTSMIIDANRMQTYNSATQQVYYWEFTLSTDISAARWIQRVGPRQTLCSDYISAQHVLISYGDRPRIGEYSSIVLNYGCPSPGSLIFLSEYDTMYGIMITPYYQEVSAPNLTMTNRIYSDGATIYLN